VRRVILISVMLFLAACAMKMPSYVWHKSTGPWQDPAADQIACLDEANRLPGFFAPGSLLNDPVRKTIFKDCMENWGWEHD
jgi:hypothetical protein